MPYAPTSDIFANLSPDRSGPGVDVIRLTSSMVSDTLDLPIYPKAMRIYVPATSPAVTLMVTPMAEASDTSPVPITVPPGGASYEPISVRRIWATGSLNLFITGVEILLLRA